MFQSYFLKEKNPKDQNTQVTATPNILPDFTNDIPEHTQALALSQSICILIQPLHMHVYSPAPLMPWVPSMVSLWHLFPASSLPLAPEDRSFRACLVHDYEHCVLAKKKTLPQLHTMAYLDCSVHVVPWGWSRNPMGHP